MKKILIVLLTLLLLILPGCEKNDTSVEKPDDTGISFVDALDHPVTVNTGTDKVIALSGSFAETWLLAGGDLIGASADAFLSISLPESVQDVGSLHSPSLEQIIELEPDLLILSKTIPNHVKLYDQLHAAGIVTAYFEVEIFDEYLNMLKICTDITGRPDLYKENGTAIREQMDEVIHKANLSSFHPKILLLRTNSTDITVRNSQTMAGAMLEDLNCINIADSDNGLLDNLSIEVIITEDPDFIFAVPMGESEEKALDTLEEQLTSNPAWAGLSAVKNGQYVILSKDLFHLKPNNRWGEAYEMLYELLYEKS